MSKKILKEAFNIRNASRTAKDGHEYRIAYIDPNTSENTFAFKDTIRKYGAKFFSDLKAWGWFLGSNPEEVYRTKIQPCLEYLTTVEDEGKGTRQNQVTSIIDGLIQELNSGEVSQLNIPTVKSLQEELIQFKADLLNCVSSEEFQKRLLPIIKFQQAQGHKCSFRNALLIMFQDPQATMVKSKTAWNKMNREVVDNSHPIILFRPDKEPLKKWERDRVKRQFLQDAGVTSERELNPGQKEELRVQLSGGTIKSNDDGRRKFKNYLAYDIRFTKQMEGKEELVGDNSGKQDLDWYDKSKEEHEFTQLVMESAMKMIESSGVKIEYVPIETLNGALGVSTSGVIKLPTERYYTQNAFDTIVHEFAHELLHQRYLKLAGDKTGNNEWSQFFIQKHQGRGPIEQQAELCSWIVCKAFNLGREQSLNYVAGWGGLKDPKSAAKSFDCLASVASFIIQKIRGYINQTNAEINNDGEEFEEEY